MATGWIFSPGGRTAAGAGPVRSTGSGPIRWRNCAAGCWRRALTGSVPTATAGCPRLRRTRSGFTSPPSGISPDSRHSNSPTDAYTQLWGYCAYSVVNPRPYTACSVSLSDMQSMPDSSAQESAAGEIRIRCQRGCLGCIKYTIIFRGCQALLYKFILGYFVFCCNNRTISEEFNYV